MQLHLEVREKKFLLNEVPDDPGHLITEHVNNRSCLDFGRHLQIFSNSKFPQRKKNKNVVELEPFRTQAVQTDVGMGKNETFCVVRRHEALTGGVGVLAQERCHARLKSKFLLPL